ncbi:hypothetical protein GCM10027162_35390 [Streptomyces incanus]
MVTTAADAETTRGVLFWLLGSLSGAGWAEVGLCLAVLALALLVCLGYARTLDAFAFGQDSAASLGVSVARTRLVLLCVTALVSSAGAIGFVGLVLPHAARALVGPGHARLLPVTALAGAVFLVWADTLARTVLDPQDVPVGVVTSLVGVPAFVLVLYRTRRMRSSAPTATWAPSPTGPSCWSPPTSTGSARPCPCWPRPRSTVSRWTSPKPPPRTWTRSPPSTDCPASV